MKNTEIQRKRELTPAQKVGRWAMVVGTVAVLTSPLQIKMAPKFENLQKIRTEGELNANLAQIYHTRDKFLKHLGAGAALMYGGILLRHGKKEKRG